MVNYIHLKSNTIMIMIKTSFIFRYQKLKKYFTTKYFDLHEINIFILYRHLSGFTIILLCSQNETGNIK